MTALTTPTRHRDCPQSGQALPLVLGVILVFGIAIVGVLSVSGASGRDAKRENASNAALSAAEAGVASALSVLANSTRPLLATALPSSASPQVDAAGDGTVSWYGTLSGDTWTVTATSSVPNPAGGGALSRTVSVDARVGSTAMNPAWNYLYADASGCLTLGSSVQVTEPLYSRGSLCLNNSSRVTGSPVHVEGTIQTTSSASVGSSGSPIAELHVAGGCRYGTSGAFSTPCSAAQQVYATSQDAIPAGVKKPPVDLDFWYAGAKPGPSQSCTSGSFPGGFDTDTTLNRSRANVDLFPGTSYDCTVVVGGAQLGRIAWTAGNPGSFVIDGIVFFDGNIDMSSSSKVLYAGRGTIYASGYVALAGSMQICGAWSGSCDFTSWNPSASMLALVAGSSTDTPGFSVAQSAQFQGGIYAVGDYLQGSSAKVQGPKIADALTLAGSSQATWIPYTNLPPGAPMDTPVVVTPGWRG